MMDFGERLYRARIHAAWSHYRSAPHLPMHREFARHEVAKSIALIKGVTLAEDVTGPYDVIVRAEARNVDELGKLVVSKVQNLDGITRTLTCPVVHI